MSQVAVSGVPVFTPAKFAASSIVQAIRTLYKVGTDLNEWMDEHIEELKRSDDPLRASIGRVLEAAKFGFGLGYIASTCLIAVGQYLLGNTFAAAATVATAVVLSNPVAMTCGAIGAIYFGWMALTEKEREQILEHLSQGLSVGVELLRSLLEFAIRKSRELLDSKQLEAAKTFIKAQAEAFGRSLYDVTRQLGDLTSEAVDLISEKAGKAASAIKEAANRLGSGIGRSPRDSKRLEDSADTSPSGAYPAAPPTGPGSSSS